MTADPAFDRRIAAALNRGLLPQRFPFRRDLELAGALAERPGSFGFYDTFWPRPGRLAIVAANIGHSGLEAGLRALFLRALMRAASPLLGDPSAIIEAVSEAYAERFSGDGPDLALVLAEPMAGTYSRQSLGNCFIEFSRPADADNGSGPAGALRADALLLIAAGASALPGGLSAADADLDGSVRAVLAKSGASAAVALLYKGAPRADDRLILTIGNEAAEIAAAIGEVRRFCTGRGADAATADELELILDEVLTNIASYAYGDGMAHEIVLDVERTRTGICLELRDDGRPFDPRGIAAPDLDAGLEERDFGGLGMHFVRTLVDDIAYSREKGWNVLRLTKALTRQGGRGSDGGGRLRIEAAADEGPGGK